MAAGVAEFRKTFDFDKAAEAFVERWVEDNRVLEESKALDPLRSVERGLEILHAYTETYPDEHIVEPEVKFLIKPTPWLEFIGIIDAVIKDGSTYSIIEDKTSSRPLTEYYFSSFRNSYQILWYMWAAKEMGLFSLNKDNIPRCVINAIYIHPEKLDFRRELISKMPQTLDIAKGYLVEWAYIIELAHENKHFPHADSDVCRKWGGCEYLPLKGVGEEMQERHIRNMYVERPEAEDEIFEATS